MELRSDSPSLRQLVQGDRQIANTFAGRVIDRIGDRRRDPDDADLADALDARIRRRCSPKT
jgi:hypothetical protein